MPRTQLALFLVLAALNASCTEGPSNNSAKEGDASLMDAFSHVEKRLTELDLQLKRPENLKASLKLSLQSTAIEERVAAAVFVARHYDRKDLAEFWTQVEDHRDSEVRRVAWLERITTSATRPGGALTALKNDRDPILRASVALHASSPNACLESINDEHPLVRAIAIRRLGTFAALRGEISETMQLVIDSMLVDPHHLVRSNALATAIELDRGDTSILTALLVDGREFWDVIELGSHDLSDKEMESVFAIKDEHRFSRRMLSGQTLFHLTDADLFAYGFASFSDRLRVGAVAGEAMIRKGNKEPIADAVALLKQSAAAGPLREQLSRAYRDGPLLNDEN